LEKFSTNKSAFTCRLSKGMERIAYNEREHKDTYERCKQNFEKSIMIHTYNNKEKNLP
jgi:hypothetical protein